jgi:hypothetical protein
MKAQKITKLLLPRWKVAAKSRQGGPVLQRQVGERGSLQAGVGGRRSAQQVAECMGVHAEAALHAQSLQTRHQAAPCAAPDDFAPIAVLGVLKRHPRAMGVSECELQEITLLCAAAKKI